MKNKLNKKSSQEIKNLWNFKSHDCEVFKKRPWRKNKRGFEMIWSTWVIMILAFMLVLFLFLFFTRGSGNFLDNVKGYFSQSNLDSVIKGCNIFVDSGNSRDFCCDKKTVKYYLNGEKKEGEFNCRELMDKNFTNAEIKKMDCEEVSC